MAVAERYRQGTATEKGWILDEFVALTGYHRKHAIRVLNGSAAMPAARRGRRCVYDEAVTEGLVVLWEASDRVCGKRLKALLPILVPALERHGHLTLDPRVREQLMAVSAATMDRRLAPARAVTAGQRRRRRSRLDGARGSVPVRTFGDWQDPAPGFVEAECVPLLVPEARLVVDAVDQLRGALPFPLRGIDTDNGSEFLNEVLIGFCKGAWHRVHAVPTVSEERLGVGRAEERGGRPPPGRVWSSGRPARRRSAGPPLLGGAPVRERVRAVVQARRKDASRRPRPQALLRAGDAVWAVARLGHDSRRDEGASAGAARYAGSTRAVGRDPCGATSSGRSGRGRDDASDAANAMPTSTGFCGVWRWRGAPARCDPPTSLARDRRDTGAPGRTRSRRRGLMSSSGSRPNRIGRLFDRLRREHPGVFLPGQLRTL